MLSQSSLPAAISTQPSHMEKQSVLLICQPSFQPEFALPPFTEQLASFFTLWSWSLALRIRSGGEASWRHPDKKWRCLMVGWDAQMWMRKVCFGTVRVCYILFGKWGEKKIFPWSATPCDIPTHTLLLTFYLPLNSPAVVTFSGFLNYVLQDLKSEGRDFKKNNQCWQAPLYFKKLLHLNAVRS